MSRYFFDYVKRDSVLYDDIGTELADSSAAKTFAINAYNEMLLEQIRFGTDDPVVRIEVRDEHGEVDTNCSIYEIASKLYKASR